MLPSEFLSGVVVLWTASWFIAACSGVPWFAIDGAGLVTVELGFLCLPASNQSVACKADFTASVAAECVIGETLVLCAVVAGLLAVMHALLFTVDEPTKELVPKLPGRFCLQMVPVALSMIVGWMGCFIWQFQCLPQMTRSLVGTHPLFGWVSLVYGFVGGILVCGLHCVYVGCRMFYRYRRSAATRDQQHEVLMRTYYPRYDGSQSSDSLNAMTACV